jgi:hypothetical protein
VIDRVEHDEVGRGRLEGQVGVPVDDTGAAGARDAIGLHGVGDEVDLLAVPEP